jgi:hypothetical protein
MKTPEFGQNLTSRQRIYYVLAQEGNEQGLKRCQIARVARVNLGALHHINKLLDASIIERDGDLFRLVRGEPQKRLELCERPPLKKHDAPIIKALLEAVLISPGTQLRDLSYCVGMHLNTTQRQYRFLRQEEVISVVQLENRSEVYPGKEFVNFNPKNIICLGQ